MSVLTPREEWAWHVTTTTPNPWLGERRERDPWALWLPNPHHRCDPRAVLWRVRHRLTGPQRGCSCSRCFYHPKRRVRAQEVYDDRVRIAKLEERVRKLERAA